MDNKILKIIPTHVDDDMIDAHYLNEGKLVKIKVESKIKKILQQNIGKVIDVNMDDILRMQYTGDSNIKVKTKTIISLDEYEETNIE